MPRKPIALVKVLSLYLPSPLRSGYEFREESFDKNICHAGRGSSSLLRAADAVE